MIYLDHNATTPLLEPVKKIIQNSLNDFGNPSSHYQIAQKSKMHIETARDQIASLLNIPSDTLCFTSGGSEANNSILHQVFLNWLPKKGPCHIITSSIEHPSILNPCKQLETLGISVTYLPVDKNGQVDTKALANAITPHTKLISIMAANNETGSIQDLETIVKIAKDHTIHCHSDCTQLLGKRPVDLKQLDLDSASFSAHKIGGPKGIGALYLKDNSAFSPLILGGPQEAELRGGTENTLGIIGFGEAAKMCQNTLSQNQKHMLNLRNSLVNGLSAIDNTHINTPLNTALPNTLNISFPGIKGETLVIKLDLEGIAVSTGSACATGSIDDSHVLNSMSLPPEIIKSAIRISLGPSTQKSDIDTCIAILQKIVPQLRKTNET